MGTGSQIIVKTSLQVNDCYIGTCDDMWKGILVNGLDPLFILSNSSIRGAEYGVYLTDKSYVYIGFSSFIDNYIGIATGSPYETPATSVSIYARTPVVGCHFYTDTAIPDPYPGQEYYPDWPVSPSEIPYDQGYAAMYLTGTSDRKSVV